VSPPIVGSALLFSPRALRDAPSTVFLFENLSRRGADTMWAWWQGHVRDFRARTLVPCVVAWWTGRGKSC